MKTISVTLLLMSAISGASGQHRVHYDLFVSDTLVNYTGKMRMAIAVNGQIPMPTLDFIEGDTAEITIHNTMHHETSIHWHGLMVPNEQDGVPYLTTAPIRPHSSYTYHFVIRQSGTYWYHSHTMLQEQSGMYGAVIIHKRNEQPVKEEVMLLSDWSDENPGQIERSLHYATDWYMVRKGAVQSYGEAVRKGQFSTRLENEWKRMHAMDVSDVYYDTFLINGKKSLDRPQYQKGDTVRLKIINGSSSTYFWLRYSGGKIMVVAADGMPVKPVLVDRMIIGVSETYDVDVVIPESGKSFGFSATSEDRTGEVSLWLGKGERVASQPMPALDYFEGMKMMNGMMTSGGNMKASDMNMSLGEMDMNEAMYREPLDSVITLNYNMLRSPDVTTLPEGPYRELHFKLTGNMNRYVWTLNNKTVSESDKIKIRAGDNIRIIIANHSMMRHPMHLHGHFFRVLNQYGSYSPLKNVLDIMPMETDTIEFHASEGYGDWYFHCHILYHMMSGMGRIFSYENSPPNPQLPDARKALRKVYADDRRFYAGAELGLESNGSDGHVTLMNTRWRFSTEWHLGLRDKAGYESESHFGRFLGRNQFLFLYAGWDWRYREGHPSGEDLFGQANSKNKRSVAHLGLEYTLPWFIVADLSLDHTGKVRAQFSRTDVPVTNRLRLFGKWNTDYEYTIGGRYIISKYISASSHYDSDMGYGAGLTITY